MEGRRTPRVLSIPAGVPFLPELASAFLQGRLVEGFVHDGDPLSLASATIYVPTRRAARALRSCFVDRLGGEAAILPTIRPLGEFDEDAVLFEAGDVAELSLAPPIEPLDRILLLAPLVQAWKKRLPAHVAALFGEEIVAPASLADAIWLARDLSGLMDEVETAGAEWTRLAGLAPADLAHWWQVTLEFLDIVTRAWPELLAERDRSNPAFHRSALIRAEAERLGRNPPKGPVVAAGSTGSIPATAELLAVIARLPSGAIVLPGLDRTMDERSWEAIGMAGDPASYGHPQGGLKKLLGAIGLARIDVAEIAQPGRVVAARLAVVREALRPSQTTDEWTSVARPSATSLDGVAIVEATNEREEAAAIAVAMRVAVGKGRSTALVTGDRELAGRVAAELRRFDIEADDSGGSPLARAAPATLFACMSQAALRPGDPALLLELLTHPLLRLGMERNRVRTAAETVDLVALRGGTGRPDVANLPSLIETRLRRREHAGHRPAWLRRLDPARLEDARNLSFALQGALSPLCSMRGGTVSLRVLLRAAVESFEALGRDEQGGLGELYAGEPGQAFARFLRGVVATTAEVEVEAREWPDVLDALLAGQTVKPSMAGDSRVAIWGALEARLQSVDTLIVGGLNEGSWPRKAEPDRFMSRGMKAGLELDPPERRIGQAAHDFFMALGAPELVLSRSARAGNAPAMASRWLQRIEAFAGPDVSAAARQRGSDILGWARMLDEAPDIAFAPRPNPKPPLAKRPTRFSVTEIETLRRDPYAVYARRILGLERIDPLLRDPGAAERGTLFHAIIHAFSLSVGDTADAEAEALLLSAGRAAFDAEELPPDVEAVWWPRFVSMVPHLVAWERSRPPGIKVRLTELRAAPTPVGAFGETLSARADRIDLLAADMADVLDFKTGSTPSKAQAHTLLAPQLALEAALLMRGAFEGVSPRMPADLAYVRLKPNGRVEQESILEYKRQPKSAPQLADEAWQRLEMLLAHYRDPETGYRSRALPFREADFSGDYDHLARVLEWSAGGDDEGDGE